MRQATCHDCGLTTTIGSFYSFQGKTYCEPCVWKASKEAAEKGQPSEYTSLTDNSICARCGSYSGDSKDHAVIGKLPLCGTCAPQVISWPYPQWLKASLAVVLALLLIALSTGRKYFKAGKSLYIGERLVDEKQYAKALPYLEETLKIAPRSDKAVFLAAKAALKIGDIATADKAIQGHNGGYFEDANDSDYLEVKALWDRAIGAAEKANKATELAKQGGHDVEAAKLMHDAASAYPEAEGLSEAATQLDAGAAFERKDYDAFLELEQKQWKQYPESGTAAAVASAFACKYAVTGNADFRKQAEDMLKQAEERAKADPKQMENFREYEERIRYRLQSREIIDKPEYDRWFRQGQAAGK